MRRLTSLLTIEEALAAILARARAACRRSLCRSARPPDVSSPRMLARRSTCLRSRARRWTASPFVRPIRPERCRSSGGSPPGGPPRVRSQAGEAMGIATGGVVPDGADAVVPVEYVVKHDNSVEIGSPVEAGAHVRPRGGDLRGGRRRARSGTRARPCSGRCARGCGAGRRRLREAPARDRPQHRNRVAEPGRAARARPDLRVERRHACRRSPLVPVPRSSRSPPPRTTRPLIARRSSKGSRLTCSSHPEACPSARTISCAGSRPSSVSRRSSGASR